MECAYSGDVYLFPKKEAEKYRECGFSVFISPFFRVKIQKQWRLYLKWEKQAFQTQAIFVTCNKFKKSGRKLQKKRKSCNFPPFFREILQISSRLSPLRGLLLQLKRQLHKIHQHGEHARHNNRHDDDRQRELPFDHL